jgi:hypothetical protein
MHCFGFVDGLRGVGMNAVADKETAKPLLGDASVGLATGDLSQDLVEAAVVVGHRSPRLGADASVPISAARKACAARERGGSLSVIRTASPQTLRTIHRRWKLIRP